MRKVCIIPARSGSKGLVDKNMLFIDGKPLVFHTIDAAIGSKIFQKENIYVSTDSVEYAEIIETKGIKVVLRKDSVSSDNTTTFEMLKDFFLEEEKEECIFMLLQPTSPLRTSQQVIDAYHMYESTEEAETVVSFVEATESPMLQTTITSKGFIQGIDGVDKNYRRQEIQKKYMPNGAIFIAKKSVYLKNESFFTNKTVPFIMDKKTSIDVDSEEDFYQAVGAIFFDYAEREKRNKSMYNRWYKKKLNTNQSHWILGDSRMLSYSKEKYENFSIGGITLATVNENIREDTFKLIPSKVLIALGINDIITGYSDEEIIENLTNMFETFHEKNTKVKIVLITQTLFNARASNSRITKLNEDIKKMCIHDRINFLDLNPIVCHNGKLNYEYTQDGLHFNDEANEIVMREIEQFLIGEEW